jgi:YD repeat-containing protein
VAVETGRWTQTVNASGDVARVTNVTDNSIAGRATEYDVHGQLLAAKTPSGGKVLLKYNLRHQLSEYKNEDLTLKFQWTAFGALQRIDGPGTDVVIYEYDSAQRLVGVRKQLTYASLDESALRQFAQTLRRLVELPIGTAHAQVVLPPLIPVPPFTPVPRPRTPIPTDPGEVLMPSQPPPDASRDLARRLGDSIQSVIDRLLCTPECKLLQAEIDAWTGAVRKRYLDMVVDKNNLFCTRPEGKNSWKGHQDKYSGDQTTLRNLIARARAINCPYNPEADDWANRQAPICPG